MLASNLLIFYLFVPPWFRILFLIHSDIGWCTSRSTSTLILILLILFFQETLLASVEFGHRSFFFRLKNKLYPASHCVLLYNLYFQQTCYFFDNKSSLILRQTSNQNRIKQDLFWIEQKVESIRGKILFEYVKDVIHVN